MGFFGRFAKSSLFNLQHFQHVLPQSLDPESSLKMTDRNQPTWMRFVSFIFSFAGGICVVALAVSTIFFQDLVVGNGNLNGVFPILLFTIVPLVGLFILDLCRSWTMAGFLWAHDQLRDGTNAIVGGMIFVGLTILHPLIGLSIPIVVAFGVAGMWLTKRLGQGTSIWDFSPNEAVALFSGRDKFGLYLAQQPFTFTRAIDAFLHATIWCSLIVACALASWLAAEDILNEAAIIAVMLLTYWSVDAVCRYFHGRLVQTNVSEPANTNVTAYDVSQAGRDASQNVGLVVENLTISDDQGFEILRNVSFAVAPGTVLGIRGPSAAGKTMLLNALVDPWGIDGIGVSGAVEMNGEAFWHRNATLTVSHVVHVRNTPNILKATGLENVTCFQGQQFHRRAEYVLEELVPSSDAIARILNCKNAQTLSDTEQKALAFARAFLIGPSVYLFDRPEDYMSDEKIQALAHKIKLEQRLGRSFILVTNNRVLQNLCDDILVLQDGQMNDYGPAGHVNDRLSNGWSRLICARTVESENALQNWLCTQFRRKNDDDNRRNISVFGGELLALSSMERDSDPSEEIVFDFKNFVGHCILRVTDSSAPLSSGQIQKAQKNGTDPKLLSTSPLVRLFAGALSFEQHVENGKRTLSFKVETYDPRKVQNLNPKPMAKVIV